MILFMWNVQDRQIHRLVVVRGRWGGDNELEVTLLMTWKFPFQSDKNILELGTCGGCPTFEYTDNHWIILFKWVNSMVFISPPPVVSMGVWVDKIQKEVLRKRVMSVEG